MGEPKPSLAEEGERIAKQLGNGVIYNGPWMRKGKFIGHTFSDVAVTGTTFVCQELEDCKAKLIQRRKEFGAEPPKEEEQVRKNNQSGFTLVESILVIVIAAALVFAAYHFGWGSQETARETVTLNDIKTVQTAVGAFALQSNRFPTDDGKLPTEGEHKLLIWHASFTISGREFVFYPDFIKRLPKTWNKGVWQIDSRGNVFVPSE